MGSSQRQTFAQQSMGVRDALGINASIAQTVANSAFGKSYAAS